MKLLATFPSQDEAHRVRLTCEWYGIKPPEFGVRRAGASAVWVEPMPHHHDDPVAGWYVQCVCKPSAGLIGPFATAQEALAVSVSADAFASWSQRLNH